MKKCSKCGDIKPLENFHKLLTSKDGRRGVCNICRNKTDRSRRAVTASKYCYNKERSKEYYENNKEKINQYSRDYYNKNKDIRRERTNELARKSYNKMMSNPEKRLKKNVRTLFRMVLKNKLVTKNNSTFSYTGIQWGEYLDHLKKDPLWVDYVSGTQALCIDHILPLCYYDYTDPDEIEKCWNPKNLRLLPAQENMEKHNKFIPELVEQYQIHHLLPKKLLTEYKI